MTSRSIHLLGSRGSKRNACGSLSATSLAVGPEQVEQVTCRRCALSVSAKTARRAQAFWHTMTLEIDDFHLSLTPSCTAPAGAQCRLVCASGCGEWDVLRDAQGLYHEVARERPDGEIEMVRHELKDGRVCNAVLYLSHADDPHICHTGGREVLTSFTISPFWDGDGYSWRRPQALL